MIDLVVNPSTTARFTSHPETITFNGFVYQPVPLAVGVEDQTTDGQLPQMTVDVSNFGGMALKFARDNDLALNDVTIRRINISLTGSGQADLIKLQILSAIFADEAARFNLGFNFNYDAEGPRLTYNRRDYPSIPFRADKFLVF